MKSAISRILSVERHRLLLIGGAVFALGLGAWLWRRAHVWLVADGRTRFVKIAGPRVCDVLAAQGIVLGARDFVTPPKDARVSPYIKLCVTRVIERPIDVRHWTPPAVHSELRTASNLRSIVAQRGYAVETTDTYLATFYDGKEQRRRLVKHRVVHQPFYRLTLFDAHGAAVKTYNLLKAKNMKTIATAYYVGDPLVPSDETFLGYKLRRGLIAVDPKVIPLRTRLYVPGYGYGYAADTGSKIKRRRIDLAVKNHHEELRYMHRPMTVYILEEAPRW